MDIMRDAKTATLGRTLIRDAEEVNAFSKLSRYETAIERSLSKAVYELRQRLQAGRKAEGDVPPPAVVDVEVSGV